MDRFRELEAFVTVVDEGSFVAAGEALHLSKAAVSRAVIQLEARLGARLLQRTTRRLSLTEAGRNYYGMARQILADMEEADGQISAAATVLSGKLKLNAPLSFGVMHLAGMWGGFMARHPDIELEITLGDRIENLVEEGYDMAIRISRLADSSLVSRRLAATRIVACAAPAYLARHGTPRRVTDLARHAVVAYTLKSGGDLWRFETPDGVQEVMTRPRMRTDNGDTCRAVALAGEGIVAQPAFLVGADLAAGRLVEVLPGCQLGEIGVYAVYPSRKHLSAKVRALMDYLAECFSPPPWQEV